MLKIVSTFVLILSASLCSLAQSWELGGMLGGSNYHGDLAYNIVPKATRFSGGIFYKYNFNEYWSIKPTISYLKISGADSNFDEYRLRNLSFRNNILEVGSMFEFNFQQFSNRTIHRKSTFYAMAGIAAFLHKPEAKLNDEWYDLTAIGTESQRYGKVQIAVPFGGGVKHAVTPNLIVGLEVGWRKTFTDYLDDVSRLYPDMTGGGSEASLLTDRSWEVSENNKQLANTGDQRGDPNLKDWYFQTAFTISYRFTPIKCPF
tara:strand:- start:382 stop:1161 length:780 start_codon:yes stop_codon:yes gene_type:complete